MSFVYTPANTWHGTITIPSDGDDENAASVNVPYEALADDVFYLYSRTNGALRLMQPPATLSSDNLGTSFTGTASASLTTMNIGTQGPLIVGDYVFVELSACLTWTKGAGAYSNPSGWIWDKQGASAGLHMTGAYANATLIDLGATSSLSLSFVTAQVTMRSTRIITTPGTYNAYFEAWVGGAGSNVTVGNVCGTVSVFRQN